MIKIAKFALMSPFLTYAEVMPSKPAKDLIHILPTHFQRDLVFQPLLKRSNTCESARKSVELSQEDVKTLKSQKKLVLGSKDVLKLMNQEQTNRIVVFIVHNNDIEALNKHIVGLCR